MILMSIVLWALVDVEDVAEGDFTSGNNKEHSMGKKLPRVKRKLPSIGLSH